MSQIIKHFCQLLSPRSYLKNVSTVLSIKTYSDVSSKERLAAHQKEIMARGLPKQKSIAGVKNIILVVSGKGGVGKSTTAVNIAAAMADHKKYDIGLLDADVFGPSVPLMIGINESPAFSDDNKMIPPIKYGVKCMSIGFLVTEKSAVIWRGLMVMSALEKLLRHVNWGDVDFLIIDTPPGTGDTLLSLIQNIPISGVVIVSTPQKASVQVTRRGATMLQKLSVPIVGIVENMSSINCPKCNHDIDIFGSYTQNLCDELGVSLIGKIPLDPSVAVSCDAGIPVVLSSPQSKQAQQYKVIAECISDFVEKKTMAANG